MPNLMTTDTPRSDEIAPHRVIPGFYASPEERQGLVNELFDDVAQHYDRIVSLMSLGTGKAYRKSVLRRIGVCRGSRVLDVACGTGLVSVAATELVGADGEVMGVDPSEGMRRVAATRRGVRTCVGTADDLPFPDQSFDFVVMGYALRHVADLVAAFSEMRRVLKPGGSVMILEITAPEQRMARWMLRCYLKGVVPPVTLLMTGSRPAMRLMAYYWETIAECVRPETILHAMERAGLEGPSRQTTMRIFNEYSARAPGAGATGP